MGKTIISTLLILLADPAAPEKPSGGAAWDAGIADGFVHALGERPPPGFEGADFWPKLECTGMSGWLMFFATPHPGDGIQCIFDDQEHACAYLRYPRPEPCQLRARIIESRASSLDSLAGVARSFVERIPVDGLSPDPKGPPAISLSRSGTKPTSFTLICRKDRESTFRLLLYSKVLRSKIDISLPTNMSSAWRASPDLMLSERIGKLDTSWEPIELAEDGEQWLIVWREAEGGNGNNASGSETYTMIFFDTKNSMPPRIARLPLGEATWSRSVSDEGFSASFTSKLLCPSGGARRSSGGALLVQLSQACETSPDPRISGRAPSLADRCNATCARKPKPDPRAGFYLLSGNEFVHLRGKELRVPRASGELVIVERPEPGYYSSGKIGYVELVNTSSDILILNEMELVSGGMRSVIVDRDTPCVVDAGASVVLLDYWDSKVPGPVCHLRESLSGQGRIELLAGKTVITRSDKTWPRRDNQ